MLFIPIKESKVSIRTTSVYGGVKYLKTHREQPDFLEPEHTLLNGMWWGTAPEEATVMEFDFALSWAEFIGEETLTESITIYAVGSKELNEPR